LSAARQEVADHEEEHGPEEELQSDLDKANSTAQERERRVEDLEAELKDLSPEDVEAKKERAEDALDNTREERRALKSDLDKVQGRLESDDLRGLHGRLEEARQDLEEAQAEVDRLQQQAEAAKLLYETLTEKRKEARRQYLAPLREEVEELLSRFFGADRATVQFGETFGVERFSRSGDGSFEFDQLSAGAKQQLSVLTRLAMARLICQERPHPVFLDDALSDTDPDRFGAIANILRSIAREMQIIMTTCHHERHRRLGVTTKRMESLKQQAVEE
jgi:DNA repair exonuclease SbcCD ATPase subunit